MDATMKLALLAPLFVATTAYAQAPGEYEEGTGAPGLAPVVVPVEAVVPAPKPRRWSVGLGIGSMGLAPHGAPEAESEFAVGQLAVRYRATRRLEIELAFAGGREQLEGYDGDRYEGDREVSSAVLALRYRFAPEHRWNWWLMAGLGSLAVTHHHASDHEREYAQQSTLQFGAGLERRFHRFAVQLELRAVGVKANDEDVAAPVPDMREPGTGVMALPPTTLGNGNGMAGGQLLLSGNYYF